jgi:hypothetical protein
VLLQQNPPPTDFQNSGLQQNSPPIQSALPVNQNVIGVVGELINELQEILNMRAMANRKNEISQNISKLKEIQQESIYDPDTIFNIISNNINYVECSFLDVRNQEKRKKSLTEIYNSLKQASNISL